MDTMDSIAVVFFLFPAMVAGAMFYFMPDARKIIGIIAFIYFSIWPVALIYIGDGAKNGIHSQIFGTMLMCLPLFFGLGKIYYEHALLVAAMGLYFYIIWPVSLMLSGNPGDAMWSSITILFQFAFVPIVLLILYLYGWQRLLSRKATSLEDHVIQEELRRSDSFSWFTKK